MWPQLDLSTPFPCSSPFHGSLLPPAEVQAPQLLRGPLIWLLLTPSLTSRQLPSCPLCFCRAEVLSTESLGGSTEPLDTSCPLPLRACPHHKGKLPCQVGTCSPGRVHLHYALPVRAAHRASCVWGWMTGHMRQRDGRREWVGR